MQGFLSYKAFSIATERAAARAELIAAGAVTNAERSVRHWSAELLQAALDADPDRLQRAAEELVGAQARRDAVRHETECLGATLEGLCVSARSLYLEEDTRAMDQWLEGGMTTSSCSSIDATAERLANDIYPVLREAREHLDQVGQVIGELERAVDQFIAGLDAAI